MVRMEMPSAASLSMRAYISSIGTGLLVLSYSLQYPQSRLQRRMGMMCASTGCLVSAKADAIMRHSRVRLCTALKPRRIRFDRAIPVRLTFY